MRFRIVLAIALLTSGFSAVQLALPDLTFACSCMQPQPIAAYANEPNTLILKGTVTVYDQATHRGELRVDRMYKGTTNVADVPIRGGDGADCGVTLSGGQTLVMVAFEEEGVLVPNICSPFGDVSTAEGQDLEAQTVEAYGEGTPVPSGGDTAQPDGFAIPGIVLYGGAAILAIIVIVAGASFISSRRGA